jgi:Kef-type K+ transport system membrane component KefB
MYNKKNDNYCILIYVLYRVILISIGYVIFMFTVVRWSLAAIHRFLVKRDNEMNLLFLIGIFLVLITSSFFCEVLGIHSFFGAFIAGIVCPKSGKFTAELFPKLKLVTVHLLLPLFFAASGMRTSLGSLNDKFYGGITVLVFAVATLAKFLPALFITKIVTRESWKFSTAVGILMNTRGLVELIALNIGLQLHILSPRLFTMFIIMALVTTFMTCPLLWLVYLRTYKPDPLIPKTPTNKIDIPGRRYLQTRKPDPLMSSTYNNSRGRIPIRHYLRTDKPITHINNGYNNTANISDNHHLRVRPTISTITKY